MLQNSSDGMELVAGGDSSALPEAEESRIDILALARLLLSEGRLVLFIALSFTICATLIAFLLPPRFTSVASFIPPSLGSGSSMAAALAGQLSILSGSDVPGKSSGELYAGILKSRSVASDIVSKFDLIHVYKVKKESEAEKALDANTLVTVDTKSSIVTVSVSDKSAIRARDIANAYMEALRTTQGRLALGQSSQRRLFFGEQLAKEKDDLEDAEVDLKKTEENSGLIAPAGQTEVEIRTIAETRAQIAVREVQLAALRQSATDQNPDVIRLRSEIDDLQGQLARLQTGNGKSANSSIPASKVPELQLDYVRKEREVKYHEALFDMLSKQFEAARLDEAHDAPVLQVLDSASLPDTKSFPKRSYFVVGGFVFGLLVGCAWVLFKAYLHTARG